MEHQGPFASRIRLLDLPDELLLQILHTLEDESVKEGATSAEFLQLKTVCKRLQRAVDSSITSLSRGIARKFCRGKRLREVRGELQRQLARWGRLRRVELHVRGSNCALSQLIPALGQSCAGLTALCIVKADLEPGVTRTCRSISQLTSLTSLKSLSLTGFDSFTATLPPLPSLQTLTAGFETLTCPSPLPALEKLVLSSENVSGSGFLRRHLQAPHLHTFPRLRHLSLTCVSMEQLHLPRSLQVLDLDDVQLGFPLDLGTELPELADVRLDRLKDREGVKVAPQGLATLLSRGTLWQLKLYSVILPPGQLALRPGLEPLSRHSSQLQPPRLGEVVATLTSLELLNLEELHCLDVSHLRLQHLRLGFLQQLSSIEGLDLQTRLTSLAFHVLPRITQLPDFRSFQSLAALTIIHLRLKNWNLNTCSCLPRLKRLCLKSILITSPGASSATSAAVSDGCSPQQDPPPTASSLDLGSLSSLTELDLSLLPISGVDVSHLPRLMAIQIGSCPLSHLSGLHSFPHLHTLILDHMPELQSLSVASCPRLSTFSCRLDNLRHLSLENLPGLSSTADFVLPGLHTMSVTSCPSLINISLHQLRSRESRANWVAAHLLAVQRRYLGQ